MNKSNCYRLSIYLITAFVLFVSGWYAHGWYDCHFVKQKQRLVTAKGYKFTNPLLDVELPEGVFVGFEPIPFRHKVLTLVDKQIKDKQALEISVYYRDLQDGPWFGINENREFNPASMMKVPVMIAWLKRAEKNPRVLQKTLVFDGKHDLSMHQHIHPYRTLTSGNKYTIEELLHYMLNYSDNNATSLLYSGLTDNELGAVLDGMDVNNNVRDNNNSITIHGYSGFFRILYNASYLSRDMSEKALEMLSLQDFPQGIASGVPSGIKVAAKFGEYGYIEGSPKEERQLHEFGIVYHHSQPYILGIMTRGGDFDKQAGIIREISKLIYSEVDSSAMKAVSK